MTNRLSSQGGEVIIRQLAVTFKERGRTFTALTPSDMHLAPGSFTAIIGPSGCGKSTLMNAIAGFVQPTGGEIQIDGETVKNTPDSVGVIFQQYGLFPWLSALGNVMFALKRFSPGRHELRRRAEAALEEVGLAKQGAKYPGQLSGGMKQRVSLARTLATEPRVLLMDEPFGALDAQTRVQMQELLIQVWKKHRATVLFITHDVDEALRLADTVHVMSASPGRVMQSYSLEEGERPRQLNRQNGRLLDIREDIIALLRPAEPQTLRQ